LLEAKTPVSVYSNSIVVTGGGIVLLKMIVQSLVFAVVLGLLLFLPAGTLAWPQAWVFMILFIACSEATGVWLLKTDPALLAARMKSPLSADQKPRDRAVIAAILILLCAWLVFIALDARRFGWSQTPLWAQMLGALLILAAFHGWVGVLKSNSFAAVTVQLQQERGQTVISTGPYAVVRHPMYAYALLFMIGVPLLLGSLWGLLGVVLFIPLLAARTLGEEAMLMDGLPGYRDYTAKVRYRLVPGVW
jgi:protein-S-isoprenylcysteine O-methyltransferase Ste14